ncbi:hypothetical protein B0T22DRAFT_457864 [Podospora appendiculata]|uniref:Uncharacterized protein n=1 Tax=Podospora appendiculata TaxID=314037 RepID=A0AAE0X800_9PEZI|nr:hypothetical protein B0T22DRAFT_457864 [Podospora appendiculata]
MKYETAMFALAGIASARDVSIYSMRMAKREVPQEHSHEAVLRIVNTNLQLNNPLKIQDTVFALLGDKAAAAGAPNVKDLACLQQIVADQAFTNAKAAGDLEGQANAIIFRALERNTGSVGLASALCTSVVAVNPEIAVITQHQDPASPEAAGNKDIELNVAKQLAAIGADPLLALQSGTFAPGKIGDPTGAGNTCDVATDAVGCIISQNLLTPAATEAEIKAAVADVAAGGAAAGAAAGAAVAAAPAANASAAVGAGAGAAASAGAAAGAANAAAGASATVNVQAFTGTLGGAAPPVVSSNSERAFAVNGATFLKEAAAIQRSCAIQKNACANAANSGQLAGGAGQCDTQEKACLAASGAAARRFKKARRAALDFGSCGSPAIKFAVGLDGRKEASFQSANLKDFNHGSALNIKVIADFTCNKLQSTCKASAATVAACQSAATAAEADKAQAAADAFNSALGVSA